MRDEKQEYTPHSELSLRCTFPGAPIAHAMAWLKPNTSANGPASSDNWNHLRETRFGAFRLHR